MWKDSKIGKGLKSSIKACYEVTGNNLNLLVNKLGKQGITIFDVKRQEKINKVYITVHKHQAKKFIAITKELCYTVKRKKEKGLALPLLYLYRNVGVFVGIIIFSALLYFGNRIVLGIEFTGTGKVYQTQVMEYLNEKGIRIYSDFASINLKTLGDEILKANDRLSFANCQKIGNRLVVDLAIATTTDDILKGNVTELYSDVDGVVETIKVYRGTSLVEIGQEVKKGDLLVGGYSEIKEQIVQMNVIAFVTVLTSETVILSSPNDNMENQAVSLAEERFSGQEILNSSVEKTQSDGEFIYTVKMQFRKVYYVG